MKDATSNVYTLGRPAALTVEFGRPGFGAEPPRVDPQPDGLDFSIHEVTGGTDGYTVFGLKRGDTGLPQVWRANTRDGLKFTDAVMLFELPPTASGARWLAGDLALRERTLYLLQCECGNPATSGHPFHVFAGDTDGGNWRRLDREMAYRGQDAFTLLWNPRLGRFVNYQTSYQPFDKRYTDNMPGVRRVLHIRTSPDCLTWTPGGSFGVTGPHLPDSQLIVPDALDTPDTEFYHFSPFDLGEFWAGALVKYISQPPVVGNMDGWPHGPFLGYEWWIADDGMNWTRPFREASGMDGVHRAFPYQLTKPVVVGDELRWPLAGRGVYTLNRKRMFYVGCRANCEIRTPVLAIPQHGMSVDLAFEPTGRGYLLAELLDKEGRVLPGFEKEQCVVKAAAQTRLELEWNGAHSAAPQTAAHLRLCFRDARVYSVSL